MNKIHKYLYNLEDWKLWFGGWAVIIAITWIVAWVIMRRG